MTDTVPSSEVKDLFQRLLYLCWEDAVDNDDDPQDKLVYKTLDLWDADPECDHDVDDAPGGGVACKRCGGWFCY
jgi:hypothetical protein